MQKFSKLSNYLLAFTKLLGFTIKYYVLAWKKRWKLIFYFDFFSKNTHFFITLDTH